MPGGGAFVDPALLLFPAGVLTLEEVEDDVGATGTEGAFFTPGAEGGPTTVTPGGSGTPPGPTAGAEFGPPTGFVTGAAEPNKSFALIEGGMDLLAELGADAKMSAACRLFEVSKGLAPPTLPDDDDGADPNRSDAPADDDEELEKKPSGMELNTPRAPEADPDPAPPPTLDPPKDGGGGTESKGDAFETI